MCRDTITEQKQAEREKHQRAVEQYLASGGQIMQLPAQKFAKGGGNPPTEQEQISRRRGNRAGLAAMQARRVG